MSTASKIKRARLLYRERGLKWLAVSALGELPVLPSIFAKMANIAMPSGPFVALAGVHSNQLWHERRSSIRRVAGQFLTKPCDVLEVGTWMGKGSTQVWLQTLPAGSSLTLVDAWRPYIAEGETAAATVGMDGLHHVAINTTLKEIYKNEARLSVSLVRAESKNFLPLLKDQSFDLIYIDGSHYYADAKRDMQEAKRLLRPGGVICGDDLDTAPRDDLVALARANMESDLFVLPDGNAFHPGVLLAVTEEFERVNCENGFWWTDPVH
ncbi:class I SAM-dependent methyltransferase [Bradyrhizobium sp. CCGE-LA001]|uniref:class I SAM-dependent methyltransferase n=1 Tax=Bradyrhizobium sp. CCGE-LA001 TaxID=1223566 RepID=UPI0011982813|nr:class I SAM-dependent methyltransferase [Bradyrhizobium sp. CCGE-LA001]